MPLGCYAKQRVYIECKHSSEISFLVRALWLSEPRSPQALAVWNFAARD